MKYKAVIADVDGTLIPPGEYPVKRPSERLLKAVRLAKGIGVALSLASARSRPWVQTLIDDLKINSPVILDNGGTIYDPWRKKYLFRSDLNKEKIRDIYNFLRDEKDVHVQIVEGENRDHRVDTPEKMEGDRAAKIIILNITPVRAEEIYQKLNQIPTIHVTKSISGTAPIKESIHITNSDATKQLAVGRLAEIMKIKTSEIIAIGDSYNDFPLLMACGLKVAMGNAVAEIKEIADYIAPSYKEDGVAEVIERYILNKKY